MSKWSKYQKRAKNQFRRHLEELDREEREAKLEIQDDLLRYGYEDWDDDDYEDDFSDYEPYFLDGFFDNDHDLYLLDDLDEFRNDDSIDPLPGTHLKVTNNGSTSYFLVLKGKRFANLLTGEVLYRLPYGEVEKIL